MRFLPRLSCTLFISIGVLLLPLLAFAQHKPPVQLPDAPAPSFILQSAPSDSSSETGFDAQASTPAQPGADQKKQSKDSGAGQTKRIFFIIPNFRAVSTSEVLPAQTPKEKFLTATDDSFDYSSIFIPGALAVYSMARRTYPEFGDGADSYGKYFWHAAVDQTSENYMVEFVFPVITHEDTRYYTLGHGTALHRVGYALSRAVVTRTDSAQPSFNFSEVVGAGASAALSTTYYPASSRTFSNIASAWAVDVGIDSASFVVKEFWPDINRHFQHRVNSPRPVQ